MWPWLLQQQMLRPLLSLLLLLLLLAIATVDSIETNSLAYLYVVGGNEMMGEDVLTVFRVAILTFVPILKDTRVSIVRKDVLSMVWGAGAGIFT